MSGVSDDAKAKLTVAFHSVDKDKNGQIDSTEVEAVLTSYYASAKKPCDPTKIKQESKVGFFLSLSKCFLNETK